MIKMVVGSRPITAPNRLGRVIGSARRAKGLSPDAFAKKIGREKSYVAEMERGAKKLTYKDLERIAKALGTNAFTLIWKAQPQSVKRKPMMKEIHKVFDSAFKKLDAMMKKCAKKAK